LVNGEDVLAPALSEAEWDALRERVAAQGLLVILPCCGAQGFLRRNHLGTQHFAHKPGADACEMEGETVQHLAAKAEIVKACRASRYDASTEIPGEGWRADVLAWRGNVRVAFEVQWSFLRLDECEYRQARYAQDGVRGCWFFRKPPPALARDSRAHAGPGLKARHDLPLFQLIASADNHFAIELNGQQHTIAAFVQRLLGGGVRYCSHASATLTQAAEVVLYECPCPRCGYRSVVYAVDTLLRADCGLLVAAPSAEGEALLYDAHVAAAVANYGASAEGQSLGMGDLKLRDGKMSQGCARCDRAFTPREILGEHQALRRRGRSDEGDGWLGRFEVALPLRSAITVPVAHWCCPEDGQSFCCEDR
jgi:hypothetical protein